jgi:hypothetical protein
MMKRQLYCLLISQRLRCPKRQRTSYKCINLWSNSRKLRFTPLSRPPSRGAARATRGNYVTKKSENDETLKKYKIKSRGNLVFYLPLRKRHFSWLKFEIKI